MHVGEAFECFTASKATPRSTAQTSSPRALISNLKQITSALIAHLSHSSMTGENMKLTRRVPKLCIRKRHTRMATAIPMMPFCEMEVLMVRPCTGMEETRSVRLR